MLVCSIIHVTLNANIGEFGDICRAKLRNLTGEIVEVAVKSLQACDTPDDKKNFEKEMAISADPKIDHPNIVKVYGLVEGGKI